MTDEEGLVDKAVSDAEARGYARGRADARVALALMADELRMMPEKWVDAYGALATAALSDGMEGRGADPNPKVPPKTTKARVSTRQVETRGLATRGKAPFPKGGADVRSLRLLAVKTRIDRRLRALAREIEAELAGGKGGDVRRCSRCKKFGEDSWSWCPYDGASMESADPTV